MKQLLTLILLISAIPAVATPPVGATYKVLLNWDASPDPTVLGYFAYCSTNAFWSGTNMLAPASFVATIDCGNSTNLVIQGLSYGPIYHYAVTCYTTNQLESDYSNELLLRISKPGAIKANTVLRQ